MNVTGFHIAFLCHRFSRRGRHFLQSIFDQIGDYPRIHLTGFYAEEEDAEELSKAHQSEDSRVTLRLYQRSVDRIMERPILFSMIGGLDGYSHVVYIDCDLWFPPDFWAEYAYALSQKQFGYYSSYVAEVPYDLAETLVATERIEEHCILPCVRGLQYPNLQGAVGHFQCVPNDLAQYPAHRIATVAQVDHAFYQWAMERSEDKSRERRLRSRLAYHLGHPRTWEGATVRM